MELATVMLHIVESLSLGVAVALAPPAAPTPAAVRPAPLVRFTSDFAESVEGVIEANRPMVIAYDPARLPQCRDTYMAQPAWQIDMRYRFDGGPELSATLSDGRGGVPPRNIDVPAGAHRVETWFLVYGQRSGCTAYDSDYGRNYTFTVARPGVARADQPSHSLPGRLPSSVMSRVGEMFAAGASP